MGLRFLRHVVELLLGAALGAWLMHALLQLWAGLSGAPPVLDELPARAWGALVGGLAGLAVQSLRDALALRRLEAWLHLAKAEDHAPDPPQRLHGFTGWRGRLAALAPWGSTGLWTELAARVHAALRQREQRIAAEAERLAQFLDAIEASPNGVMLLDPGGHLMWCSRVAAAHFGLDPARDQGQRLTNLLRAPAFVAHLQPLLGQAGFDGDAPTREPVTVASPARGLQLSVLATGFGQGLVLVVSQDVTAQLRSETQRRDFVANVSHEIRTPLTVLAGFVDALADLPLDADERARVLGLMRQQAQRMQALVDDLLTLARIEGSAPPAPDRWVNLQALIEAVQVEATALSAGRHRLQWPAGEAATLLASCELAGNETELRSALANLLSNAVRYTPEGGEVALAVTRRAEGRLALSVRDSGIGIAPEHLPRITERFYRVDGSRSRATGGTGLGLAIVKHVAQRHGGELLVESTPGQGSTFTLLLPALRVRAAPATDGR